MNRVRNASSAVALICRNAGATSKRALSSLIERARQGSRTSVRQVSVALKDSETPDCPPIDLDSLERIQQFVAEAGSSLKEASTTKLKSEWRAALQDALKPLALTTLCDEHLSAMTVDIWRCKGANLEKILLDLQEHLENLTLYYGPNRLRMDEVPSDRWPKARR